MRLLILGENSYVGTSVKNYCLQHHPEMEIKVISSRDEKWKAFPFSDFDAVYNVSGLCHADSRHGTPEMYKKINSDLPVQMAEKAKIEGVKLFIQMSSSIIYGNMSMIGIKKCISENTEPKPINIYGESKLNAEKRLLNLENEKFGVVILRCPLIYSENAKDNFPRLVKFAKYMPIFPKIENEQSMIYIDNLAELVYLIIKNEKRGVYMPQDKEYICTSKLVKDIADAAGNKLYLISIFNPIICALSKKMYFFNKVFGNIVYEKKISQYFDGAYRVVNYKEAVDRIVNAADKR